QNTISGTQDLYISILSDDGASLLASTYLGGSGPEGMFTGASTGNYTSLQSATVKTVDVVFDNNNNIWIASNTSSTYHPVTTNAFKNTLGGATDMIMTKLNPQLSNIIYSTYYGGTALEGLHNVEMTDDGTQVVFAGHTSSSDFPVSSGVVGTTHNG